MRRRLRGAFLRRCPCVRPPSGDSTMPHSKGCYLVYHFICIICIVYNFLVHMYIFLLFLFFYFVYNLHLFEQHFSTGADGWIIISDLALYCCGSYYMYVCICCYTVYLTICFVYNSKFCIKFKMNVACSGKLFRKRILSGKLLLFRKLYLLLITNIYKNTLHTFF